MDGSMSDKKPRFEARKYYDNAWDVFDYKRCIYVVTKLDKRTAHLFANAEEMADMLEEIQWKDRNYSWMRSGVPTINAVCPWCKALHDLHADDCKLAELLAKIEGKA